MNTYFILILWIFPCHLSKACIFLPWHYRWHLAWLGTNGIWIMSMMKARVLKTTKVATNWNWNGPCRNGRNARTLAKMARKFVLLNALWSETEMRRSYLTNFAWIRDCHLHRPYKAVDSPVVPNGQLRVGLLVINPNALPNTLDFKPETFFVALQTQLKRPWKTNIARQF